MAANNETINRLKRLALPISLGAFALVMILMAVIYFLQTQQQGDLREEAELLQQRLAITAEISEELEQQFEQVSQYIPVVSANPVEGEWAEVEFQQAVINIIKVHAKDNPSYPNILIEPPEGVPNFSIDTSEPRQGVRLGSSIYRVYTFEINIENVTYDEIMLLAYNLAELTELRTLVVEDIEYGEIPYEEVRIYIGVYTKAR